MSIPAPLSAARDRFAGMSDEQSTQNGQDAVQLPDTPDQVLPGPHTGAPEDIPEHNTAPDGQPGHVKAAGFEDSTATA